jgi:hypothetical protein
MSFAVKFQFRVFVLSCFRVFWISSALSQHNSLHEKRRGIEVHDRFQEARAKCSVNGDGRLDDSGGSPLEAKAHDGPPKQITIARKYESTKKSNPEEKHQNGRLNYRGILGLDLPERDAVLRIATGAQSRGASLI